VEVLVINFSSADRICSTHGKTKGSGCRYQ